MYPQHVRSVVTRNISKSRVFPLGEVFFRREEPPFPSTIPLRFRVSVRNTEGDGTRTSRYPSAREGTVRFYRFFGNRALPRSPSEGDGDQSAWLHTETRSLLPMLIRRQYSGKESGSIEHAKRCFSF